MNQRIYGYYFSVVVEKGEKGWVGYAPGVGGVYVEAETSEEAAAVAYDAAKAILDCRYEQNDPIIENNEYLKILHNPPKQHYINTIAGINNGYIVTTPCPVAV
jgi:predicted RNase H-like HicB family nuclease